MAAKPIKFLELHYTMTQFLIIMNIQILAESGRVLESGSFRETNIKRQKKSFDTLLLTINIKVGCHVQCFCLKTKMILLRDQVFAWVCAIRYFPHTCNMIKFFFNLNPDHLK